MKIANPFERFGITSADYDGNENYGKFVIEPGSADHVATALFLGKFNVTQLGFDLIGGSKGGRNHQSKRNSEKLFHIVPQKQGKIFNNA